MHYRQYSPPSPLRHLVRYFWSFDSFDHRKTTLTIKSFADKFPRMIFQVLDGFEPIRDQFGNVMPVCYLSGLDTRSSIATMGSTFSHFGASFYPHALTTIFRIGAHELINTMPDITDICRCQVKNQLEQAKDHTQRVSVLSRYLISKLDETSESDLMIQHIIHSGEIRDTTPLQALNKKYAISERQIQRRFRFVVGISPKKFQRLIRFEKSLQLLRAAQYRDLTTIAHNIGYADQSHFIKEFREFAGISPYTFVRDKDVGSESSSFLYETA